MEIAGRWLVDVTGIEPATPCLQSKCGNAMWLLRLAFTYVLHDGFAWCLAVIVPNLFPTFGRRHLPQLGSQRHLFGND